MERIRLTSGNAEFRGFTRTEALLSVGKLADAMIVATQDNSHYENCRGALRVGYDVLLEKPISTTAAQVLEIGRLAQHAQPAAGCASCRGRTRCRPGQCY